MALLERLGLHRRELRAWAAYDWANSPFITVVITAVFPLFFAEVAMDGVEGRAADSRLAWATAISLGIIALASPILGAIADHAPIKKRMLGLFALVGAVATCAMAMLGEGDWLPALLLFGVGQIGATGAFVFYDSLLPHIAREDEADRVSTAGYALGYLGGGLLLGVVILLSLKPGWFGLATGWSGARVGFLLVGAWWIAFSVPLFRHVAEPPITAVGARPQGLALVRASFAGLRVTFRELRRYRQATIFLVAFVIYNDGVGAIIRLAVVYGAAIGLEGTPMIVAILITQFIGIPCTFLFGQLAGRLGTKPAIYAGLVVYCAVAVLGYFMSTVTHFYLLAGLVGLVQGGVQALSRSLFATMIPRARSSEMFALFGVFEKFAGILGPTLFAVIQEVTGSSRNGIFSVIAFFLIGGALLTRVDVAAGRAAARAADAKAT